MSEKIVDARGLACPQPVLLTRKALKDHARLTAIVDNETAEQNVTRMAEKEGFKVTREKRADGIYLAIAGEGALADAPEAPVACAGGGPAGPLVLTIPSDCMGRGDQELGQLLVRTFLHTLGEVAPQPDTLVFFNSGVKLAVEGSPVLEDLRALAAKGAQLLVCGTCLGHFGLKEKLAVGEVSNMYAIAEAWLRAGKVITI
ncbi:MAG: sulfurtransferase-like selenium metabolism protein YedF [Acidobacteriota bacterium]|jgi:selenium metabolism protein YedF|nr:sulfurtransferase-like selenium metabolism protein YedF [Acidobacteriota bacterium]